MLGILAVVAVLIICIAIVASKNVKAMNKCVDETIALIQQNHKITEVPSEDYQEMTAYGVMKFHVKQYDIDEVGNLSVMTVNVGMMQMATIVFTPTEKNIPLLSCDYMYILGNRKAYLELYDLVEEKDEKYMKWMDAYRAARDKYSNLEDTSASKAWYENLLTVVTYKAGKSKDDESLKSLLLDMVSVYLNQADGYEVLTSEQQAAKKAIIKKYSDRLIDEGGISTDFFKSSFGADITRDFFDKVFFGTAK